MQKVYRASGTLDTFSSLCERCSTLRSNWNAATSTLFLRTARVEASGTHLISRRPDPRIFRRSARLAAGAETQSPVETHASAHQRRHLNYTTLHCRHHRPSYPALYCVTKHTIPLDIHARQQQFLDEDPRGSPLTPELSLCCAIAPRPRRSPPTCSCKQPRPPPAKPSTNT